MGNLEHLVSEPLPNDDLVADTTGEMATTVRHYHGVDIVAIGGDVDMVTGPDMNAAINRCLARHPDCLVIDLTDTVFFGSAGLRALLDVRERAAPDTEVRVVAASRSTQWPIRITGIHDVLAVFPSLHQALAGTGRLRGIA